jgi:hypothetical protein
LFHHPGSFLFHHPSKPPFILVRFSITDPHILTNDDRENKGMKMRKKKREQIDINHKRPEIEHVAF